MKIKLSKKEIDLVVQNRDSDEIILNIQNNKICLDKLETKIKFSIKYQSKNTNRLIKKWIDNGGTPDLILYEDVSLLYYAISHNKYKLAKFLLQNGSNANGVDKYHKSLLMYAFDGCNPEMIYLLIEHGADLFYFNSYSGYEVLDYIYYVNRQTLNAIILNIIKIKNLNRIRLFKLLSKIKIFNMEEDVAENLRNDYINLFKMVSNEYSEIFNYKDKLNDKIINNINDINLLNIIYKSTFYKYKICKMKKINYNVLKLDNKKMLV